MFHKGINAIIFKNIKKEYLTLLAIIDVNKELFGDILKNYEPEKLLSLKTLNEIEDFISIFVSIVYSALDISEDKLRETISP